MANNWFLEGPPRLHVRKLGSDGPAVVMVHGIVSGSLASWLMTAAPRISRDHQVIMYDLRGHGLSERPASGYRMDDMLSDLERVVEGVDQFAMVGHSYGAVISLTAALRWPDRVAKVFCVDPPFGVTVRQLDAEEVRPSTLRRYGRSFAETTLLEDISTDRMFPITELGELSCPIKMVFGDSSPYRSGATAVVDVLGADAVSVLPGGHALHVDAKAEVATMIAEFLRA